MKFPVTSAVLLVAVPLSLLLPGCSGGGLPGNPFPTAIATATPAPATSQTSNFTLGNGQRAILKTTIRGTNIIGTMQILAPLSGRAAATLTRSIKIGTFSITGTFTPERGYSIVVRDGNTTLFTLSGLFPTATEAGSYTLSFGGETDSGTIPIAGSPTPTATARPTTTATARPTTTPTVTPSGTPTPTPAPGISRVQNIVITPGSGFNGTTRPTLLSGPTPNFNNFSSFAAPSNPLGGDTNLVFEGPVLNRPARVGDSFTLQNRQATLGILYYSEATASGPARSWESTGGTMRVTAVTDSSVTFTLTNVVFSPQSFGSTSATGTFTLNGNGVFNGS